MGPGAWWPAPHPEAACKGARTSPTVGTSEVRARAFPPDLPPKSLFPVRLPASAIVGPRRQVALLRLHAAVGRISALPPVRHASP
jgi:hypothetical protein